MASNKSRALQSIPFQPKKDFLAGSTRISIFHHLIPDNGISENEKKIILKKKIYIYV